jgi:hypothetical protein
MLFPYFKTFEEERLQNNPLSTVRHICKSTTLQISKNLQNFYKIKIGKPPHLFVSIHKICTQDKSKFEVLYQLTKLHYHHLHNDGLLDL